MHFPLKSARQFASLSQQKQLLDKQAADLPSLIHKDLAPQLIEYELGKVHREAPELGETEVPRTQAAAMFSAVLGLDKALEELGSGDLLQLYDLVASDPGGPYRQIPSQPLTSTHEPVEPALVPRAVDRFFEWVQSPSFADMHPIQQMSLSQMRLYEIQPFPKFSQLTVSLFSHYFLLQAKYLVPLYEVGELPKFYRALGQAFLFSSEALVDFNLQACQRAYEHVLSLRGISHNG